MTKQPHKIYLVPETEDVTIVPPHKRFDQEIRKSSMPASGRTFPPEEDSSEEGEEIEKMKKKLKTAFILLAFFLVLWAAYFLIYYSLYQLLKGH